VLSGLVRLMAHVEPWRWKVCADPAWVRYERGLACYEDGGYVDHAAARAMWDQAAAAS
jgi:hypothetical protein